MVRDGWSFRDISWLGSAATGNGAEINENNVIVDITCYGDLEASWKVLVAMHLKTMIAG